MISPGWKGLLLVLRTAILAGQYQSKGIIRGGVVDNANLIAQGNGRFHECNRPWNLLNHLGCRHSMAILTDPLGNPRDVEIRAFMIDEHHDHSVRQRFCTSCEVEFDGWE